MTTIKLRTRPDDLRVMLKLPEYNHVYYDAAVAHALVRAIGELQQARIMRGARSDIIAWLHYRAAAILADDFGIPATQRSEGEEGWH